ncbi:Wzz/FepE/Etk N-terminal domain-containing protein [Bradyrhizobium erythrophlei]|uniref:tyrosine-protein kinase domain-containing protein n=1 Tax=Bradyrhizobium erythrophlei TaxID=1437360 RepID=UPI0035E6B7AE
MEALVRKRMRQLTVLPDTVPGARMGEQSVGTNDGMQSLKQVLESLRKYRRLILRIVIVGAILAGLASLFVSPTYLATAQLAVDVRQPAATEGAPAAAAGQGAEESIIDTHVTVLLSDAYLRQLLPTLRELQDARHRAAGGWIQSLRTQVHDAWTNIKALIGGEAKPDDGAALAALKGSLKIGQERRSRIIGVSAASPDPQKAADIANTVAQSYVEALTRQKRSEAENALNALAVRSTKIQADLAQAEQELKNYRLAGQVVPSRDAALEWKVTTLAQQFETLLRRRQELTATGLVVQPDVSLRATASPPERPASLPPLLLVPPAVIALALFACVLAVVLDRLDHTLRTEADATSALNVPCVGVMPTIPLEPGVQPQYFLEQPTSSYSRAIRSILVSLLASDPVVQQRIVLVTSSVGGEGKTLLARSLGVYAARLGRRTLLMDFGQFGRRPSDESANLRGVLSYDRPLADAVQYIPEFGIDYLPAGLSDGNRLGVFANPKIAPLLRQLGEAYDLVIIDGPSLLEVPEARLIASWADHILLAVRSGSTHRDLALAALHQLARTEHLHPNRDTSISVVLTRADPSGNDQATQPADDRPNPLVARYQRYEAAITRWFTPKAAIEAMHSAWAKLRARS